MADSELERKKSNWSPVASGLIAAAVGYFAWRYGPTSVPPIIALLFLGCAANVVYGLLQWIGPTQNSPVSVLTGISVMLSRICLIVFVSCLLWDVFSAEANPLTRLSSERDVWTFALGVFVLAMLLWIAAMGVMTATTVWLMVRHDVLGKNADASVAE